MVAEIPGYPIRKLPFAGPETRTKAAISIAQFPHHHGHATEGGNEVVGNLRAWPCRTVHMGLHSGVGWTDGLMD